MMNKTVRKQITGGLYLVIDPSIEQSKLLNKLQSALSGGVDVVQIWNHWPDGTDKIELITKVADVCKPYQIPLLINEEWQLLLQTTDLDGVHFDRFPEDFTGIQKAIGKQKITGITCSGNLDVVNFAEENRMDYISFCAMFPSSSAGACTIVLPETVRIANERTTLPLFISGGITPENCEQLKQLIPFNGVAVISGILNAENPLKQAQAYKNALLNHLQAS